jgi:DNA-binding HxlR family transcriptional regulator
MIEPIASIVISVLGKDYERQNCSIARALEAIGERWTLLIVRDAFCGVRRFNDFHAHLDIPKAVLSDRLHGLVEDGIMERCEDSEHAVRSHYELTPVGRELWPVLHSLLVWGERHRGPSSRVFRHADCGTQLDESAGCPKCGLTPKPQDVVTAPRRDRPSGRDDPVALALRSEHRLLDPLIR